MEESSGIRLVTGGAGFLGSHLCERLLKENLTVHCIDNLSSGSLANLDVIRNHPRFIFEKEDICQPLIGYKASEIYNLGCPASPIQYQKNPIATLKTNIFGAYHLLQLSKNLSAKILQASTSEVYGDPLEHPQRESYWGNVNPIGTRACYDEGKRAAETLFYDFYRQYDVAIKIARLFNVYGPRMQANDGRVIPNFILQALQNKPLMIHGHGLQSRSFCYVTDIIDGLIRLMQSPKDFTGPVNLGTTAELSILDLAKMIIELTGSRSKLIFTPNRDDDPKCRQPNIQLATTQLKFKPLVKLADGLQLTIAYFEKMLSLESNNSANHKVLINN